MASSPTWDTLRSSLRRHRPSTDTHEPKVSRSAARDLEHALRRTVDGEVRFDVGSRALYATDLSIYRHVPVGVVVPRDEADVQATVAACRERGVPILGRGCGTSLSGQTCNVAVVLDFSKYMNKLLELDPVAKLARVQPGLINDQLREAAKVHGLTYAPDPATHPYCTLGGNIGNNSCGAHTLRGGKTVDNTHELEILTYDGLRMKVGKTSPEEFDRIVRQGGRRAEIYRGLKAIAGRYGDEIRRRYPDIPRRVSGYNLDSLLPEYGFHLAQALVGSESTCALTLSATMRLIDFPDKRALVVIAYDDIATAADEVPHIRELDCYALEAVQHRVIANMRRKDHPLAGAKLLPEADSYLIVEFAGHDQKEANAAAEAALNRLKKARSKATGHCLFESEADQQAIWKVREAGVDASHIPIVENSWPSWEDAAVPPERLGDYLRDFEKLNKRFGYEYTLFGHFGDGCVHARMTFGLKTPEGVRQFREYMEAASDLVLSYGGSLSGEHGDGQAKGELLPKMFGPELIEAFREFKRLWDPAWKMNPGKIIDAQPLDTGLRLGPDYNPKPVETKFSFGEDDHSFALAGERCFGVGRCRTLGGQTMCPSFQATREEMHSTRGRAHLLFEMMRGDTITDGWKSDAVHEALDLCLQCKGCKHDCPVSVDMATYKAEFLSHYYEGRLRPRAAYSMGLIFRWLRLGSVAPGLVNAALKAPVVGPTIKWLAGFTQIRPAPMFAEQSFRDWWNWRGGNGTAVSSRPPVILWADTFNNYYLPGTLKAAVTVLEDAGYRVTVPNAHLCCGRPLYDYGMLDLAKAKLEQIVEELRPAIRQGIPVVGLEPSCVSVFRDEMLNLIPGNADARRLAEQTKTLSELLLENAEWHPPRLDGKAILQTHCHHKSVLDREGDQKLLERVGLEVEIPPVGCCGHAGSFGYESEHAPLSLDIAEQVLLPAVRDTSPDTLVVADGFSCRQQIKDGSERWAMHPAEVLALAIETNGSHSGAAPDRRYLDPEAAPSKAAKWTTAALIGGLVVWGLTAALSRARR